MIIAFAYDVLSATMQVLAYGAIAICSIGLLLCGILIF